MLSLQTSTNTILFEKEIERKMTVDSNVLLKDTCIDIMQNIGLKHLASNAKVSIKISECKYHTFESFIPNLDLNIGSLKSIFGNSLVFKILVPGKVEEFNAIELKKTFCSNFLHLIIIRYSSIKNCITDPIFKDIIESIENNTIESLSYENLLQMNETIQEELNFSNNFKNEPKILTNIGIQSYQNSNSLLLGSPINLNLKIPNTIPSIVPVINDKGNITEDNNIPIPPQPYFVPTNKPFIEYHKTLLNILQKTPPSMEGPNIIETVFPTTPKKGPPNSRSRICFDQNTETPILELWFEITRTPSPSQLQDYADHLNNLSNRSNDDKITSHNVKIWFKNRRAKENRVNKYFNNTD
uniref:Homeobox domain-containing protein n=1 Tax=Strongyloides venezuelensis TaxID=75913 RepID=A0A0K0F383_STRVS